MRYELKGGAPTNSKTVYPPKRERFSTPLPLAPKVFASQKRFSATPTFFFPPEYAGD
jgi:hypothetical protein